MDWTPIVSGIAVIGFVYGFLRNFKQDIHKDLERMNRRIDLQEERMFSWAQSMNQRIDLQEERMFLLATGKTLQQAMTEAKMNQESRKK